MAALLVARGWKLGTAESCTGGMLASWLTGEAGCSYWYVGGIVAYANAVKMQLLGVEEKMLIEHGAVSAEVACAMVQGLLAAMADVDVAVATTGIAGPSGGSVAKPVGLVYGAVALRSGKLIVREHLFTGNRSAIQIAASQAVLDMVYETLAWEETRP